MKTLGLCSLFLSFALFTPAPSVAQSAGLANTDKDAIQKWLAHKDQSRPGYRFVLPPQDNSFVISTNDLEPGCMYMRTYRVKREARDSDATRPAGYTTCVPVGGFAVKMAVIRNGESELGQNAPPQ